MMRQSLHTTALLLSLLFALDKVAASCVNLTSSNICSTVLPYSYVSIPDNVCPTLVSPYLSTSLTPSLWGILTPTCAARLAAYMCAQAYPPCSLGHVAPCSDMCAPLATECAGVFSTLQQFLSINCSTSSASSSPSSSPSSMSTTSSTTSSTPTKTAQCTNFSLTSAPTPVAKCVSYYSNNSGGLCAGVFHSDYLVFVPWQSSIAAMEAPLYAVEFVFRSFEHACAMQLATFMCETALPSCDFSSSTYPIPVPSPPCHSQCDTLQTVCSSVFTSLRNSSNVLYQYLASQLQPQADCNSIGNYPWSAENVQCGRILANATLDFPTVQKIYAQLPGLNLTAKCNTGQTNSIATMQLSNLQCPSPLLVSTNYETNAGKGACAVPCPVIEYTSDEWYKLDVLFSVFATLSVWLSLFLVLTWSIFPVKRQQRYNLFFFISLVSLYFVFWVGVLVNGGRFSHISCANETTQCQWGDTSCQLCTAQAFILVVCTLSGTAWWTVIAVELCLKVFLRKLTGAVELWFTRVATVFGIFFPLIFGLPPLALKAYTADTAVQWCFIHDPSLQNTYFWIPLLVCGGVVTLVMVAVLVQVWRSANSVRAKGKWKRLIRPIAFILIFYYFVVFNCFIHFYSSANLDNYNESATSFVTCLLSASPSTCGNAPSQRMGVGIMYADTFTSASLGTFVFLVYATTPDVWKLWMGLILRGSVAGLSTSGSGGNSDKNSGGAITPRGASASNQIIREPSVSSKRIPRKMSDRGGGMRRAPSGRDVRAPADKDKTLLNGNSNPVAPPSTVLPGSLVNSAISPRQVLLVSNITSSPQPSPSIVPSAPPSAQPHHQRNTSQRSSSQGGAHSHDATGPMIATTEMVTISPPQSSHAAPFTVVAETSAPSSPSQHLAPQPAPHIAIVGSGTARNQI